jgi:hypothetical protein
MSRERHLAEGDRRVALEARQKRRADRLAARRVRKRHRDELAMTASKEESSD